ncbi:MAG: zinc ribbon domain-containing protein [Chloroflexaceae bacterium]|nr:zinc ribbon domain-containing protein [Chloroflexaceae bacterium]
MPTYVYTCDECGKQFEQFQSFKDEPLGQCPCPNRSQQVRRVFQPVGIVFKGSGWYVTDSRNTNSASTTSKSTVSNDSGNIPESSKNERESSAKSENGDTSAPVKQPETTASND